MYLNTAPPGWKALTTGADMVLAISDASGSDGPYKVNGGNPDSAATWTITGLVADAHTHTGASHTHTATTDAGTYTDADPRAGVDGTPVQRVHTHAITTDATTPGASSAASAAGVTHTPGWRPKASVGKLFQLDTA